jgi:hypothetical protein
MTATANLTLGVHAPTFTLSTPYSVTAGQGSTNIINFYAYQEFGFTGNVNLSISGLPSGVTASFSPSSTSFSSTLTLNVAASAPVGTSTVTVTGTSGSQTVTTTFQLSINVPSFTFYSSISSLSLNEGASGTAYLYVTPQYGFTGNAVLSASGLPNGVTASFSPNPPTPPTGISTLTLTASNNATPGAATITLTATSGSLTQTNSFVLTINSPNFTLATAPSEVTLSPGGSEKSTLTITAQNGFSGSISYAASGLPSGVTASFSPNPSSGPSALTLTAADTATPVSGTVMITGTSGSLVATTALPVKVRAARTASTTNLSLTSASSSASSTVTLGTLVTATAIVTAGSTPLTTGQVNFCDATATSCDATHLLGTAQLTNAGTAVLQFIPGAGSHSYIAVFAGTNTNAVSTSAASNLSVTAALPTAASIAQSGSAGNYTLTATITSQGPIVPSGNVSFLDTTDSNFSLASAKLISSVPAFSLSVSQSPTIGAQPESVATGDFNGDGIPDLAVANTGANTITVLLGNGDGTFKSAASLQTGSAPYTLVAGDFNRDGHVDLAVTLNSNNSSGINVFLGNGDGTFTPSGSNPPTGIQPSGMTVGDYNGDGLLDLAVANAGNGTVTILLGNGDGTFTPANLSPQLVSPTGSMVQGDFNGDGILDLAVSGLYDGNLTILLGDGDGSFTPAGVFSEGNGSNSIATGDLNGDGKLDLVVGNAYSATLSILLGNGDGTFTAPATAPAISNYLAAIAVADLNNDGKADIVITNYYDSNITVLLGNGDGTFAAGTTTATGVDPLALAVGDWNGDGINDVAVANNTTLTVFTSQLAQTATASASGISPIGQVTVDASYAGDTVYAASTSATTTLGISAPAVTLSLSSASITTAQALTVTIAVNGGSTNPVPTGSVKLTSGNYTSAVATLSGGSATIVIPAGTLPVGTEVLTASFTPDSAGAATYKSATGTASVVVTQGVLANTTTSFVLSNGNLTFTATVASATGGIPTGSVSFYAGQTLLGMGTLTNGVASYTATAFPTGNVSLTAQYSGDADFMPSTSAATPVLAVTQGSPTLTVAAAGTASDVLTLAVAPGYAGTLQLTCTGLPQNATCTFAPSSVVFSGSSNSSTSTLTITTGTSASLSLPSSLFGGSRTITWVATLGLPGLFALALASRRRKLKVALRTMALLLLLGGFANALTGCGGSNSGSSNSGSGTTTPSGTYTVQVVATGGSGVTQTTSLNVTVQ